MLHVRAVWLGCIVAAAATSMPRIAGAELLDFRTTVESRTEQLRSGGVEAFESAIDDFPLSSETLPIEARTALSLTTDGELIAQGRGLAIFVEPDFGPPPVGVFGPDPDEMGVSAAAFSASADVRYRVQCRVRESRDFVFTPEETRQSAGTPIDLTSTLFLSGGLIVWGPEDPADLTGATVDASITVVQRPTGAADDALIELITFHASLVGQPDGNADLSVMALVNGEPFEVAVDVVPPGGSLNGSSGGQVDFSRLPVPYVYSAIVGEADEADAPFTLEAFVEIVCDSGLSGTGAAAVLGAPLFTDRRPRGPLSRLVAQVAAGVAPDEAGDSTTSTPLFGLPGSLCGTLGAELALLSIGLLVLGFRRCSAAPFLILRVTNQFINQSGGEILRHHLARYRLNLHHVSSQNAPRLADGK